MLSAKIRFKILGRKFSMNAHLGVSREMMHAKLSLEHTTPEPPSPLRPRKFLLF
jgi:hypothetical protein